MQLPILWQLSILPYLGKKSNIIGSNINSHFSLKKPPKCLVLLTGTVTLAVTQPDAEGEKSERINPVLNDGGY